MATILGVFGRITVLETGRSTARFNLDLGLGIWVRSRRPKLKTSIITFGSTLRWPSYLRNNERPSLTNLKLAILFTLFNIGQETAMPTPPLMETNTPSIPQLPTGLLNIKL